MGNMVIVAIKQTLLFNSSGVYFRAICVRQYSFGHRMGSECAQEAEKQGFGHRNGTICVCQNSFGHRMGLKCAQEAEIQVFGHRNGAICAREHSFGHKISSKRAQAAEI